MIKRLFITLSIFILALSACSPAAPEMVTVEKIVAEGAAPQEEADMGAGFGDSATTSNATDVEQMIIKNGDLVIVVEDPPASVRRISEMAEAMGGFVVSSNVTQMALEEGIQVPHAYMTIRVPAERLTEAMDRIKQESDQLPRSENVNSQDVTDEYTDLASRLRNLEAAEEQLMAIMDDATRTEDVLAVYNELVRVREEIEVIKGQMQYYEQSAALSAISVELIADEADQPLQIGGWQPGGVVKEAFELLVRTLQGLVDFAIWLVVYILPVLLCLAIPVVILILVIRRWRKSRKAKAVPPAQ